MLPLTQPRTHPDREIHAGVGTKRAVVLQETDREAVVGTVPPFVLAHTSFHILAHLCVLAALAEVHNSCSPSTHKELHLCLCVGRVI